MTFKLPPEPPKDPAERLEFAHRSLQHLLTLAERAAGEGRLVPIPTAPSVTRGKALRVQPESPSKD